MTVTAFYLPGVAPRDYKEGDAIPIKVVKLDSIKTQLPYDYYSLPFCSPSSVEEVSESLGEVMSGEKIENSMYKVIMNMEESCQIVCRKVYTEKELGKFAEKIDEEVSAHTHNRHRHTTHKTLHSQKGNILMAHLCIICVVLCFRAVPRELVARSFARGDQIFHPGGRDAR